MWSAYNGHPDIVERLIKRGAEVNILNKVSTLIVTELLYLLSQPLFVRSVMHRL